MVFVPRGLNLQPYILTAHGNPSCEHTYGQAISGKTVAVRVELNLETDCFSGWLMGLILM